MKIRALSLTPLAILLAGVGCTKIQARTGLKDGHRFYKEENYKRAIEQYQKAAELDPNPEAFFYLGSSYQSLYRPGKETPENKEYLAKAVAAYKRALELNDGSSSNLKKIKTSTLSALTGIHTEEPYKSYEQALAYAQELVHDNPTDAKNLFAMANLYEKFGKLDEAEATYKKVADLNPKDAKACAALAGFYNRPLWDGRSKFDLAVQTMERCASLDLNNPQGYYAVAQFYWDKAYRDPLLSDLQQDEYADKGLEAVDKALTIRPDYVEAITYKGLLLRVKAKVTKDPRKRELFLDQAIALQKHATELRKEQQNASPSPTAIPSAH